MAAFCELSGMPTDYSKCIVEEVLKGQLFKEFTIRVLPGSSKGENYLGEIFRIIVKGVKEDGSEHSLSLIAKMAPFDIKMRQQVKIEKIYSREIFMYSNMLPILYKIQEDFNIPEHERFNYAKFYKGVIEEPYEMLILEDLSVKGYKMYNRLLSLDIDHAKLCVENIAYFHATTIVLRHNKPEMFDEVKNNVAEFYDFGYNFNIFMDKNKKMLMKICEGESYIDRLNAFLDSMEDTLKWYLDKDKTDSFEVLCHGDCWSNNFLFKYKDDKVTSMRMLDWQIIRLSSPVTDLSYLLFTGTDKETRANHYDQLLNLYYKTLYSSVAKMGINLNDYYPECVYREHIRKHMEYGLIMSIAILPLTLSNKGEAMEIIDIVNSVEDGGIDELIVSETCRKRLKDLIEDCIEYGIL